MLFRNIMVPHDGTSFSKRALNVALSLAKKYDSKITVVVCMDTHYSGSWYLDGRISDLNFKKQYKAAKLEIDELAADAQKHGIPFNFAIINSAKIVKTLVNYAKSHRFDLIVMGSHGRSGLNKMILGSVSNGVVQQAKCPVMIIK